MLEITPIAGLTALSLMENQVTAEMTFDSGSDYTEMAWEIWNQLGSHDKELARKDFPKLTKMMGW